MKYIMLSVAAALLLFSMGCDNDEKSSDTGADTSVTTDTSAETTPSDTGDSDSGSDTGDSDSGADTGEASDTGSDAAVSD